MAFSREARKSAATARKILARKGKAAYEAYKKTGVIPPGLEDLPKAPSGLHKKIAQRVLSAVASEPAAVASTAALKRAGGKNYVVGGAVRDAARNLDPKDVDLLVTGLSPEQVDAALRELPGDVNLTGKSFGVFRYREGASEVEIALPRTETSTGVQKKDFAVKVDQSIPVEKDLERRDFTANAIAMDVDTGRITDPFGGLADISAGVLRQTSPTTLAEDPTRVVRALTANAKHGLVPDEATRASMTANAPSIKLEPPEAIQKELDKLFSANDPASAMQLAHDTGVLQHIFPDVEAAFGFNQNNPHHEVELGEHLLNVLKRISARTPDPDLRLAALLHDIGKPASQWTDPVTGMSHYYEGVVDGKIVGADHEKVGAVMAEAALRALPGYSSDRMKRIVALIEGHMWDSFGSEKGARRFLNKYEPHADDLLTFRWADQGGKSELEGPHEDSPELRAQRDLVEAVREKGQATSQSTLAINGKDLIEAGIKQGPEVGRLLKLLTERVVDDPEINTRDQLLALARVNSALEQS